jgi:phage baseplate assembly protein W
MYEWTENYFVTEKDLSRKIKDLDYIFQPHPISKDISRKSDVEAIKQSIKTLVLLNHYEKPFHPDIGCDVYKSLFEPFEGKFTADLIMRNIRKVIEDYEPRADLKDVKVYMDEDNHTFNISVYFTPNGSINTEVVDIFLKILR